MPGYAWAGGFAPCLCAILSENMAKVSPEARRTVSQRAICQTSFVPFWLAVATIENDSSFIIIAILLRWLFLGTLFATIAIGSMRAWESYRRSEHADAYATFGVTAAIVMGWSMVLLIASR